MKEGPMDEIGTVLFAPSFPWFVVYFCFLFLLFFFKYSNWIFQIIEKSPLESLFFLN